MQRRVCPVSGHKLQAHVFVEAGRQADVRDFHLPGEALAWKTYVAAFGVSQRNRDVRSDADGIYVPCVAVQAGGQVHCQQAESWIRQPDLGDRLQDVFQHAGNGSCASST